MLCAHVQPAPAEAAKKSSDAGQAEGPRPQDKVAKTAKHTSNPVEVSWHLLRTLQPLIVRTSSAVFAISALDAVCCLLKSVLGWQGEQSSSQPQMLVCKILNQLGLACAQASKGEEEEPLRVQHKPIQRKRPRKVH